MHSEVPVEPGDLEGAPGLEAWRGEHEAASVGQARPRLDQDAERRRVDELHLAQIDDEALRSFAASLEQRLSERVRVVQVELAGKSDDDGAAVPLDPGDRLLADAGSLVLSRSVALGHDSLLSGPSSATPGRRPLRFKHRCGAYRKRARMLGCMEVAEVAARAAGENFPVGSILFPRGLRPHIRALYCYARLVDELGDAYEGDRLAALDELEAQVVQTFEGEPSWPVLRNVQPTVREFELPREPFLRLIEANRIDQRVTSYETWDDLKHYCVHS